MKNENINRMDLSILKGSFTPKELEEIVTQMIHIKIRYHEGKIDREAGEEDIKMREKRIIELQRDLFNLRKKLVQWRDSRIHAEAELRIVSHEEASPSPANVKVNGASTVK